MNRWVFMSIFFVVTFYVANRVASDIVERKEIKQCVRYEYRQQPILKKNNGVSYIGEKTAAFCAEWKYKDGVES